MGKQALGTKKIKRIEEILGAPVHVAYANGLGRPHWWAEVFPQTGRPLYVNWKTGETDAHVFYDELAQR